MGFLLTCTSYGVLGIYIFLYVFSTGPATATAIQSQNDGDLGDSGVGEGNDLVTIMLNDHDPIDLFIPSDGSLVYADLDQPTSVSNAIALGTVSATCFFWRYREDFIRPDIAQFLSHVFSTVNAGPRPGRARMEAHGREFDGAERVYCYEGSREVTVGDSFVLFFEIAGPKGKEIAGQAGEQEEVRAAAVAAAADRQGKLLTITIGKDEEFVEFPLRANPDLYHAELAVSRKAKLITEPLRESTLTWLGEGEVEFRAEAGAACYFIKADFEQKPDFRKTNIYREAWLSPTDVLDSIVCFRNSRSLHVRDRWLQKKFDDDNDDDDGRLGLLEDPKWYTAMNATYFP